MSGLELFLRENGETVLYVVFFGSLVLFGALETRAAMRASGSLRKKRWPLNAALTALNIVLLGALPVTSLIIADYARINGIGIMNQFDVPLWVGLLAGLALFSFQSWAVHYAMHYIPFLWRIHRVHHTDTHMDISTTVRFHPAEFLIQLPISASII